MNAVPRHLDEYLSVISVPDQPGYLIVECVVTDPPSTAGRTVYLHLDPEIVTPLLLELRTAARDARSQPLG